MGGITCPDRTKPWRLFFGLIGKYQWRMVAVEAWCGGEKKSGELCFG
jgi:hypothetical protein